MMKDRILMGMGRYMLPIPRIVWHRQIKAAAQRGPARLAFMSEDHHRVRDFAVTELPRTGAPLPPEAFADALDLDMDRVGAILDELEKHLTFVFRTDPRAVTWAYPVTVDETPHHASFSTGEEAYSP
jgi:hypothetical protein